MATDIFHRAPLNIEKPITADMVMIQWDSGAVAQATNLSLQYQQPINRRWTLGGVANSCVIYPGRPSGSIQIQRLMADEDENLFNNSGWDPCGTPATIYIMLNGASAIPDCTTTGGEYIARGAFVTSYNFSAEADGLTIVDNISIEFMQLDYNDSSTTTGL